MLPTFLGSLAGNDLKGDGACHMAGLLEVNTTLKELKYAAHSVA